MMQSANHRRTTRIASRMNDTRHPMAAFAAKLKPAIGLPVESHP
jgi:hypothetical protein